MRLDISYKEEDFSPKEASEITGASTALQRDWRRRGFLWERPDEAKYSRFRASDMGYLFALKAFSDAGISMQQAKEAAKVAVLPIWHFVCWPICASAEFNHRTSESKRLVIPNPGGDSAQRYVVISDGIAVQRVGSLADLANHIEGDHHTVRKPVVTTLFDCFEAARRITERSPRPLMEIEVRRMK